ncbi:MAG: M20 family metallo-hydrolase [Paludibacteraceae bacterium]|nr:M20 family metallo-hydrolase [Paludibacteraceae bacterium]
MSFEKETAEAVALLKALINIPRTSRNETEAADYLQHAMEQRGLKTYRKDNNLWTMSSEWDNNKPTLLINAHIDTVKPVAGWLTDPNCAIEENGKITGLGSNDDGASLVSLLAVFGLLTQHVQKYNLIYAASAEEEVSGKQGIENLLPDLPHIDLALVGEPTGMQPAIAEKGLMVIDATAIGKSGHAARNEGINAIYKALEDIQWICNNPLPKESDLLGPVKMTTTMIQAGTQHNVIPDKCTFVIDVRSNECYSNEEIFHHLEQHLGSELKARSFRLSSSGISVENPLVKRILSLGKEPFGSPTLSDQALMRFPSVKMGPGQSSRSHTANEFIMIDEIADAIATYYEVLDGLDIKN